MEAFKMAILLDRLMAIDVYGEMATWYIHRYPRFC